MALLAVMSVTTVMGAFGTMVDDRAHKIIGDLHARPSARAGLRAVRARRSSWAIMLIAFALAGDIVSRRPPVSKMIEAVALILLGA